MKRILSLILALLLIISLLPMGALAADNQPEKKTTKLVYINPVYARQVAARGVPQPSGRSTYATVNYLTSKSAVYEAMRSAMEARKEEIVLGIKVASSSYTSTYENDLFDDAVDYAFAHTGVPTQGDYIHYSTASIGGNSSTTSEGSYYYVTLNLAVDYNATAAQETTVTSQVNALKSSLGNSGTNYQKIKRVYDWMTANIRYDDVHVNDVTYRPQYSAYAALIQKTCVCQGYALLLYRMALEYGIDCRMIPSIDSENHIWNIVKIGNYYYNADATWDEGTTSYSWFLKSNANFPRHTRLAEYNTAAFNSSYPMGSSDFDPNTASKVTITQQPASVQVAYGEKATVTVKAAGEGLTYRWYHADAADTSFSYTSSFTGNTYSTTMNDTRNGRRIYCVISDVYGNSVTTNTVTISMLPKNYATIVTQPKSVTVAEGETAKVTLKATGDGLTYKWYYKNAGDSKYTYTSSFKSNSYSVKMTEARNGRRVLCKVYDQYGNMVQSNSVTLNMKKTALAITKQPVSVTVAKGETAKVSLTAVGDGLTYKWYYKNAGDTKYTYTSSFKTNSYSVKMTDARNGRRVLCKVYDKYGNMVQSNSVLLKMKTTQETAAIVTQPKSVTVDAGEYAIITFTARGDGLTYDWYHADVGDTKFYHTDSFTGNTYKTKMNDTRNGRRIYCVVTDAYGNKAQTNTVTINKTKAQKTTVAITAQPKSVTVAPNEYAIVSFTAVGDGLIYEWYHADVEDTQFIRTSSFINNTYKTKMTEARNGRRMYCVVTDAYGNSVKTNTVTINMDMSLMILTQPKSVTVEAGKTAKVTVVASGEGLTYTWYYKNSGASKFVKTDAFTGNTYSVTMNTSRAGRQVYCVIKDKHGDTVKSNTVTLLMKTSTGGTTVIG